MKLTVSLLLALLMLAMWPQTASAQLTKKAEDLAQKSAEDWLALADVGKYAETWDQAAEYFKNAVTKQRWIDAMKSVRAPLGTVQARKLKSATFTKNLPAAPDGDYVVIKYDTSFENKKSAVETITPMLDKDGKWRVSGYFIK